MAKGESNTMSDPVVVKQEVTLEVSPQAQLILSETKYSLEEFLQWASEYQRVNLGGQNVAGFLAHMANKVKVVEVKKSG